MGAEDYKSLTLVGSRSLSQAGILDEPFFEKRHDDKAASERERACLQKKEQQFSEDGKAGRLSDRGSRGDNTHS